jgi:hypothetical protein
MVQTVRLHDLGNLGFSNEGDRPFLQCVGDSATVPFWKLFGQIQYGPLLLGSDPVLAATATMICFQLRRLPPIVRPPVDFKSSADLIDSVL